MNVFLHSSAVPAQPKCMEPKPSYSSGSPGSAAHLGVNRPSSGQTGQWDLVFREELGRHWLDPSSTALLRYNSLVRPTENLQKK